ncbi:hypothetical protein KKA47_06345 [bacterium]|nr:hypothetical protein [bacterium]
MVTKCFGDAQYGTHSTDSKSEWLCSDETQGINTKIKTYSRRFKEDGQVYTIQAWKKTDLTTKEEDLSFILYKDGELLAEVYRDTCFFGLLNCFEKKGDEKSLAILANGFLAVTRTDTIKDALGISL